MARARTPVRRRSAVVGARARGAALVLSLIVALTLGLAATGVGDDNARRPPGLARSSGGPPPVPATATPVSVSLRPLLRGRPVSERFLGLSFEASSLPQIADFGASGNLVVLLRSLGGGMLRFGGISADTRIAWHDASTPVPAWTSGVLEAGDMRRLATLAGRSGWPVLLTVGLAHYAPLAAAREVRAAGQALGPWLAGIEIGNEPDAYARHGLRTLPWNPHVYDRQVRSYMRAISHLARSVPLAAPGVSGSHSFHRWGPTVARSQRPALLTGHHYPLGCHQTPAPSIARLLSPQTRNLAAQSLARYLAVSRGNRIPFRMDEVNSVSCGGRAGISDTFASALWATDYITEAMAAGVVGINLQGNPANCLGYTPLCATSPARLAKGVLTPRPVWYALLLTSALVGARPIATTVGLPAATPQRPERPNVAVRALLGADGTLRFVIVDDDPPGSPPLAVTLPVGARSSASLLVLQAPSPEATTGVTLGGSQVAADGSWSPRETPTLTATGRTLTVPVSPSSAALVSVPPAG